MSTSFFPRHQEAPSSSQEPFPNFEQHEGPLSTLNEGLLKDLADKRTARGGKEQKRRGPKPDSKPPLTRRQELNRQAQRTHRERKEAYIKALEDEVLRLKELYGSASQAKDKVCEENRRLKQLLAENGIAGPDSHSPGVPGIAIEYPDTTPDYAYATSATPSGHSGHSRSTSRGSRSAYTPPLTSTSLSTFPSSIVSPAFATSPSHSQVHHQADAPFSSQQQQAQISNCMDYEQAGIDFVLTLEKPCMSHLSWLVQRSNETGTDPCGHALMVSCYSEQTTGSQNPGDFANVNEETGSSHRGWELTKGDLNTLLDLSQNLNLHGEVTPVMAWGMVMAHPRFYEMHATDFQRVANELVGKVRCYGFGAVLEEFEVRDAMNEAFGVDSQIAIAY